MTGKRSRLRPKIMGIVNMTPDSLYGGILKNAVGEQNLSTYLRSIIDSGADIIDIGGESTGPGSHDVEWGEEFKRIEPALEVLEELQKTYNFQISVDTYKADVLERALDYQVDILNDVTALRGDNRMAVLVAKSRIKVCLMYMHVRLHAAGNSVRTNKSIIHYDDVIETIASFWQERIEYAKSHGIKDSQIILDPGLGAFISGDSKYSFEILERLGELKGRFSRYPILIGASRKGFLSKDGELPVAMRLKPSLAAAKLAVQNGADILRVHDVAETKNMIDSIDNPGPLI